MRQVVYVAYGPKAGREATASIASLWQHSDLPVTIITDGSAYIDVPGANIVAFPDKADAIDINPVVLSRWAKLQINKLCGGDNLCYLDADTRVRADISVGFQFIEDGWDMAMAASMNQGNAAFAHVDPTERQLTLEMLTHPLQLQAGVFFFSPARCDELFKAWRKRWLEFKGQDQAALIRAMMDAAPRVWLLGRPWNGGEMIEHKFGAAK